MIFHWYLFFSKGVVPVPLAPKSEGKTIQGDYLYEHEIHKLKYDLPCVCDLDKVYLDKFMTKAYMI